MSLTSSTLESAQATETARGRAARRDRRTCRRSRSPRSGDCRSRGSVSAGRDRGIGTTGVPGHVGSFHRSSQSSPAGSNRRIPPVAPASEVVYAYSRSTVRTGAATGVKRSRACGSSTLSSFNQSASLKTCSRRSGGTSRRARSSRCPGPRSGPAASPTAACAGRRSPR
jgi:hypothetical protein